MHAYHFIDFRKRWRQPLTVCNWHFTLVQSCLTLSVACRILATPASMVHGFCILWHAGHVTNEPYNRQSTKGRLCSLAEFQYSGWKARLWNQPAPLHVTGLAVSRISDQVAESRGKRMLFKIGRSTRCYMCIDKPRKWKYVRFRMKHFGLNRLWIFTQASKIYTTMPKRKN